MNSIDSNRIVSPEILRSVSKIAKNLQLVFTEEQLASIIAALEAGANVEALMRLIGTKGATSV